MKNVLFILLTICTLQYSYGQQLDNKTKNKIKVKYFTAQEFYKNKEYAKVLIKVAEIEELSNGVKSANIQNLKVKTYVDLEEFIRAQKELDVLQEMNLSSSIIKEIAKYSVIIEDNIEFEREQLKMLQYQEEKKRKEAAIAEKKRLEKEEKERIAKEKEKKLRAQFDFVGEFHFGLAAVRVKRKTRKKGEPINKWGYVNEDYQIVIPLQYESAGRFSKSGFASISKDVGARIIDGEFHLPKPKKGLIDRAGRIIIPMLYYKIGMYKGYFHVSNRDGLFGFYTTDGKLIVDAVCDGIATITTTTNGDDYFIVEKGNKQALISIDGQVNSGFIYDDIDELKIKGRSYGFRTKKKDLYGMLNEKGEVELENTYKEITLYANNDYGFFYRVQNPSEKYALYSISHKKVLNETYGAISWTHNKSKGTIFLYNGRKKTGCSFDQDKVDLNSCQRLKLTKDEKKIAKDRGW